MRLSPVKKNESKYMDSYVLSIERLKPEVEREMFLQYFTSGNMKCFHTIVTSYLPDVMRVAIWHSKKFGVQVQDLFQAGVIGLLKAILAYRPDCKYYLRIFSYGKIVRAIRVCIARSWSVVNISTSRDYNILFVKIRQLFNCDNVDSYNRKVETLSKEFNLTPDKINEIKERFQYSDVTLDRLNSLNKASVYINQIKDPNQTPESDLIREECNKIMYDSVLDVLQKLSEKERFIVEKRYMEDIPWTLEKIGVYFGVTRERIRQIEKKALNKLKKLLKTERDIGSILSVTF
jgi:RNA polymerase sigma-32 factor